MTAVLLGRYETESPEWWATRRGTLGGSEIAAVMGHSPWTSPFTLWHRKAGNIEEQAPNESMDWGKRLESAIVEAWWDENPDLFPLAGGTFHHAERTWQLANPDLLVSDTPDGEPTGLLEVKTADAFSSHEWGKSGTDVYPPYYADQVQWYLDVFGLPFAHLAVLIGGNDFRTYVVEYDAPYAATLRAAGQDFMASVAEGVPPLLDGSTSTYEAVRELHPEIDGGAEIDLTPEQWLPYLDTKAALKSADEAHNLAKSELMEAMGSARYGRFLGQKVVRREARGQGRPYLKEIPQAKESAA